MATWDQLSDEQRAAITAFTREAPNGQPNGPAEAAIANMARLLDDTQPSKFSRAVAGRMSEICTAQADQIRALRVAFGLSEDGVTPVEHAAKGEA